MIFTVDESGRAWFGAIDFEHPNDPKKIKWAAIDLPPPSIWEDLLMYLVVAPFLCLASVYDWWRVNVWYRIS